MSEARDGHSAVARDHAILVFGGRRNQNYKILGSCEEFIPATNTWAELPQMPKPRWATGAHTYPVRFPTAEFFNGKVYVAGDYEESTSSVEMLSIFSERPLQWTQVIYAPFIPSSVISFEGSLLFGTLCGRIYELQTNQDNENPQVKSILGN
nr:hypothetical transcript [Hymenolepis microstoma]